MPPVVPPNAVMELLERVHPRSVRDLVPLTGGSVARVFAFADDVGDWVIRFNVQGALDFGKEALVIRMLDGMDVPIPALLATGTTDATGQGLDWAISVRAPGVHLDSLPPERFVVLLPAMIALLDRIHRADLTGTTGYGSFDGRGNGSAPSWRSHLLAIREDHSGFGSDFSWEGAFARTLLERDVIDTLFAELMRLVDMCPEERWLIHGDFGFDNLLVDEREDRITGVIDWLGARFGDFLYDVAWLDFWSDADLISPFAAFYGEVGMSVPNMGERIRCYQCYMAMDALRFFALGDQPETYRWLRDRVRHLLAPA